MSSIAVESVETPSEAEKALRRVEESVEQVGADVILGEIKRNCFIIYVTIRAWRGQFLMRNSQTLVDGKPVDEKLVTKGSWKVMPEKWHKALQPYESRCRSAVYRLGVPFKDGVYIVPKARAKALVDQIKAIRVQYKEKVAEFQAEWPSVVRDLERKIVAEMGDDQWIAISKALPDARKLPELFDIEIGLWPVGNSGGMPVECFDDLQSAANQLEAVDRLVQRMLGGTGPAGVHEDGELLGAFVSDVRKVWERTMRSAGKIIEENADEWMGEAQATTNRMVAAAVEAMVSDPIREFAEQVDNLAKLTATKTVRAGTLEAVKRAYDKLQGFSFMLPSAMLERLRHIELRIGAADPQAMNGGTIAGQNLNAALRAIRDDLTSDLSHANVVEEFTRHLDI